MKEFFSKERLKSFQSDIFLTIDWGEKFFGTALCRTSSGTPKALGYWKRDTLWKTDEKRFETLIKHHDISQIIVGWPQTNQSHPTLQNNLQGIFEKNLSFNCFNPTPMNAATQQVRSFGGLLTAALRKISTPCSPEIIYWNETLSSFCAHPSYLHHIQPALANKDFLSEKRSVLKQKKRAQNIIITNTHTQQKKLAQLFSDHSLLYNHTKNASKITMQINSSHQTSAKQSCVPLNFSAENRLDHLSAKDILESFLETLTLL